MSQHRNDVYKKRSIDLGFASPSDNPFGYKPNSFEDILSKSMSANLMNSNCELQSEAGDLFKRNFDFEEEEILDLVKLSLYRHYGGPSRMNHTKPLSRKELISNMIPFLAYGDDASLSTRHDGKVKDLSSMYKIPQSSVYLALASYVADHAPSELRKYIKD